jgi:LPXTG-motif cell wall-anchored protein
MTNNRRIIIISISALIGTLLSFFIFKLRKGNAELTGKDYSTILTNFIFSIGILLAVGFVFVWRKKKDDM